MKVFLMTFGCKVNQYETQHIAELFESDGYEITDELRESDICVVNSCTVTAQSDTKLKHFISRARRENPDCVLVLAGCFPQAFPERARDLSECDIIVGTKDKNRIPQLAKEYHANRGRVFNVVDICSRSSFEPMCNTTVKNKTRAYIKIQDGCDLNCTYCIIPRARGHICSKPLNEIKRETALLVASGHKEIILTGINLCCYGRDLGGLRLIDAIEGACGVSGNFRVRLSSLEPEMISDGDIERMRALKKLCPHFHLSLQSGCDKTLAAMKRHYTSADYEALCNRLRAAFEGCAITTDIMVGFPGETDEDFAQSLDFARKIGFASAHIFPYSRRSTTPADKMDGQIQKHVKSQRAAEMARVCEKSQLEYNRTFIGKTVSVLFERESSPDFHAGHIPEYVEVRVKRKDSTSLFREQRLVKVTDADEKGCTGELVSEREEN